MTTGSSTGYTPRLVKFLNRGEQILICYLETHLVLPCARKIFHVTPWKLQQSNTTQTRIGHAAVSPDERQLLVSNLVDGVDLYALPNVSPIRNIRQSIRVNTILHVGFFPNNSLAYAGSDHGCVDIMDVDTGYVVDSIPRHRDDGLLVQIVTAYSSKQRTLIASASVEADGRSSLYIWEMSWTPIIQQEHDSLAINPYIKYSYFLGLLYVVAHMIATIFPVETQQILAAFMDRVGFLTREHGNME
ncbi:hypothetical protein NM688_g7000 [Phlebia brevispora]|uniref:Uncharacterized protein n=1 Tax=Phlebia brevispora TaxID=194682 RepID=A0ACC1SA73_9APHY|nr:hypothetical protein NM688_g7000 [Phlebia brevispora]